MRLSRAALTGLLLPAALALSACTGAAGEDEEPEPEGPGAVEFTPPPYTEPGPDVVLGTAHPSALPTEIPEKLHVSKIDPISADEIVILDGDGGLEVPLHVIDPATGESTARMVVGPGIWDAVIHPFVGESPDDPALLAAEVWRPRGSRGAADFTVSTYAGDLLEPDEILMPDYTRAHSRPGSSAVSTDGRYFVFWDDGLFGPRVYDLDQNVETGALQTVGCGPFTWLNGRDLYSVCEESRELVHLQIQDDGSLEEVARAAVLPEDFVSNRKATYAEDADKALLVSANGDVFVFDFSAGLPSEPVEPVGNAGQRSGRFDQNAIDNTGTRIAITYTDSKIHPHSMRAGDVDKIIVSDATTLDPVATLTRRSMKLSEIHSIAFSTDGSRLLVNGASTEDKDGETKPMILTFDAKTGKRVAAKEIKGFAGSPDRMITPQEIG
ncbi:hypothetical protein [Nocardioides houyundeii]|uniref:hypothetical protein n=1 Tax=Nocardioides houyundeii TaxID=2045452 RepID=UPI000DF3D3D8|nr:hypothetical protein [Nocardioides houyundeii]